MIVFLNGSINSGKTTTGRLLAQRLGAEFLDFDDISEAIPNFDLEKDLPKVFNIGIELLNNKFEKGEDIVVTFIVDDEEYELLRSNLIDPDLFFFTLSPRIEIALSNRGERELTDWERERIKYHYEIGIAEPKFGEIIDNSNLSVEETVNAIESKLIHPPGMEL